MKISSINNQPNFGWNRTTHLAITELALKNINGLSEVEKRQIARYSQMPDYDKKEIGYLKNSHFYFPLSKNQSYGKSANRYNNAKAMFNEHLQQAAMSKTREDFFKHTGYAMHYLQEVALPMHTKSGGIISKVFDYKTHRDFEKGKKHGAKVHTSKLMEKYKETPLFFSSLQDLFQGTAMFSRSKNLQVNQFNKKSWETIQQKCFNRAVDASSEFFATLFRVARP